MHNLAELFIRLFIDLVRQADAAAGTERGEAGMAETGHPLGGPLGLVIGVCVG